MATSSLASKFAKSKYLRGGGFIQDRFEEESKHITPTPVPALNLALSGDIDGGLRPGITTLAGQSKTFKCLGYDTNLEVYVSEEDYEKIKHLL